MLSSPKFFCIWKIEIRQGSLSFENPNQSALEGNDRNQKIKARGICQTRKLLDSKAKRKHYIHPTSSLARNDPYLLKIFCPENMCSIFFKSYVMGKKLLCNG